MHINIRNRPGSAVVRVEGDFLSEPDQERFRDRVKEMVDAGKREIYVDLSRVAHMNSCGLGSLVCSLVAARKAGGNIYLVNPGEKVRDLIAMTRLDTIFDVVTDTGELFVGTGVKHH